MPCCHQVQRLRARVLIGVAVMLCAGVAYAQDYPSKPIRMLIPSPPAGGTDTLGRLLRDGLQSSLGQTVVVDNRGGASGRIAAALAAKADPDGHTLLFTYGGVLTTGLPLFRKLPYHPIRDFAPVAMTAHVPNILVAHPSFAPKTLGEIIKLAKSKPGALTHGTSSIGSSSHLNMVLLKQMAGIDVLQVSYPGDGPALIALVGGHVPFAINNAVAAMPHIQSGRLRAIAVSSPQRLPTLPEVPTIVESGLPGYDALLFYCMVAPAKTPPAIIRKLHAAITQIKQTPRVQTQFARLGAVNFDMTPAELGAFVQRDLDKWTRVIQSAGIQPE